MRTYRFVIAVLLALSFTILPVAAGMARMHAASSEMSMGASGDDCPCCDAAHRCPVDTCMLKCFNVSAIAIDGSPFVAPLPAPFAPAAMTPLVAFSARPDPPPPRS
jgi:hypothetical protein